MQEEKDFHHFVLVSDEGRIQLRFQLGAMKHIREPSS